MTQEFDLSRSEKIIDKSKYSNTEVKLLERQLDIDSQKDGPMKKIVELETDILTDEQSDTKIKMFKETGETQLLGERTFSFNGIDYSLVISVFNEDDDMAVRISVLDPNGGNLSSGSTSPDLQLRQNEVSFRQYNFFDSKGVTYLSGAAASADKSPKGFAKSLILSTSLVVRLLMRKLEISKVEASMGDASVTHDGGSGWSKEMAERLGYKQSTDFTDMFTYTYD